MTLKTGGVLLALLVVLVGCTTATTKYAYDNDGSYKVETTRRTLFRVASADARVEPDGDTYVQTSDKEMSSNFAKFGVGIAKELVGTQESAPTAPTKPTSPASLPTLVEEPINVTRGPVDDE